MDANILILIYWQVSSLVCLLNQKISQSHGVHYNGLDARLHNVFISKVQGEKPRHVNCLPRISLYKLCVLDISVREMCPNTGAGGMNGGVPRLPAEQQEEPAHKDTQCYCEVQAGNLNPKILLFFLDFM